SRRTASSNSLPCLGCARTHTPNSTECRFRKSFSLLAAIPPGLAARTGTSPFYPAQVPDLIGVKDRHYLDHTGLVRHRAIGDLMRYAALNQGLDRLASFNRFVPAVAVLGPRSCRTRSTFLKRISPSVTALVTSQGRV